MSEADIRVRIRENSKKAVAQIKKNFAKVDKSRLRAKLSVDDSEVDAAKAKLETLEERKTATIRARVSKSSLAKARAQMAGLRGGTNNAGIKEKPDWGLDANDAAFNTGRRGTRGAPVMGGVQKARSVIPGYNPEKNEWDRDELRRLGVSEESVGLSRAKDGSLRDGSHFTKKGKNGRGVPGMDYDRTKTGSGRTDGFRADKTDAWRTGKKKATEYSASVKKASDRVKRHKGKLTSLTGSMKAFGRNISRFTPNIMMWWKLIGMLLPLIIALGVQAAGVAVAFGAIAVAGAGLIGLGLIGHGEGIADSFGLAKRQLNKFKRELFQTFKPTLAEFAPISWEFMEKLPQRLQPIADSLSGLTVFEDSFISAFNGVVDFVAEGLDRMNESAAILDQLAHRFGGIVGDEIFGFLEFLTTFAYENQDAMIELGGVFKNALITVWNLILVFAYMLASLRPITDLIAWLSNLLGNKFVGAMTVATVAGYMLTTAIIQAGMAVSALQVLAGTGSVWALFAGFMTTVASYAGAATIVLWEMVAALSAVQLATGAFALIAGLGAVGIGGYYAHNKLSTDSDALDKSRRRTGGGGGSTTVNNEFYVNGKDSKSATRELADKFPELYEEAESKGNATDTGI